MIKTSADFQAALAELSKAPDVTFSGVDRKMRASTYNDTMNKIEGELDSLYEDIRVFNDVTDFCEGYVIKNVKERRERFLEKLKVIEDLSDSFRDTSYVAQLVPLLQNQRPVKNRMGEDVPRMRLNKGCLEMDGGVAETATLASVFQVNKDGCFRNTAESLMGGKAARSIYYVDEPVAGGIVEEYEIRFQNPLNVNYIDVDTVNCEVESIEGLTAEDGVIDLNCAGAYTEEQMLSGVRIRLVCKSYEASVLPRNEVGIKSFTARRSKAYGNRHNFSEDETRLAHRQKILQAGLYRGKYAAWSKDKEKTDNANRLSGAEVITECRALSDNREFDDTYIELSDGSVVEALSSTGYQYTPSSQVKKTEVVFGGNYPSMQVPDFRIEPSTGLANGYAYRFGIDGITIQHRRQHEECGYVSDPVNIGECSFIELETEKESSQELEFYILDGGKETPILSVGEERVERERLYYQMPLRFVADESEEMTIYKDGVATDASIAGREGFDYANHVYEISYTPKNASHRYFPKNKSIQVKMLQRSASLPATIKSVAIRKHGGDLDWTTLE